MKRAVLFVVLTTWLSVSQVPSQQPIPPALPRPIDDEVGFAILVWQYQTDAIRDAALYDSIGLCGWHIDRGRGQKNRADWGLVNRRPFYIDHAAGKGILHLTPASGLSEIATDGTPSSRPQSLFDIETQDTLKQQLNQNLPEVVNDATLAIALDDEVSLGTFNSPLEVDFSPASVRVFQAWLSQAYSDGSALNRSWGVSDAAMCQPVPFESIRRRLESRPPRKWRLAPWMDFRTFQDETFSQVIAETTRHAMTHAKGVPVGVVGAQQPSAYGGFDYSRLRHAIQFIEAYDIGGTNEILHSFWNESPRKPRMQTFFASGNPSADRWFLWYYLAHGNRGVIAWPTVNGKPWFNEGTTHPHILKLVSAFEQVQDPALGVLSHPTTTAIQDPIAILVSQPSVRVGWAIDATSHGNTWPRRLSSLDNACLTSGKNRVAWLRLLEDLGWQAVCIDESDIRNGKLLESQTRVLILPQSHAIDRFTCDSILEFARDGGLVIADHAPAITDEHGTGYPTSPLATLFGIENLISDADPWFDGSRRFEIDGERYTKPFDDRISDASCLIDGGQPCIRRDLQTSWISNGFGKGQAVMINQSPTRLFDASIRAGEIGRRWRTKLRSIFETINLTPPLQTQRADGADHGIECLRYRTRDPGEQIWCWVANPTRQASVDGAGQTASIRHQRTELTIRPADDIASNVRSIRDIRTNESIPVSFPIQRKMMLDEAMIWSVQLSDN